MFLDGKTIYSKTKPKIIIEIILGVIFLLMAFPLFMIYGFGAMFNKRIKTIEIIIDSIGEFEDDLVRLMNKGL